jgi:lysophospholipase L1-like esterase
LKWLCKKLLLRLQCGQAGLDPLLVNTTRSKVIFDRAGMLSFYIGLAIMGPFAALMMPLLVAQGIRVRRVTPRLPEPPGARQGIHGSGPPLRLLIIGDSAAAGVGAQSQCQALSGQLIHFMGSHFRVSWKLSATTGHTIEDVVARLKAAIPEPFDVIVASVGVNDATRGTRIKRWIDRQDQFINLCSTKLGCRQILISRLPPMHLFPALPQPLRWYLGERAKRLNRALEKHLEGSRCCRLVSLNLPFDPSWMAADGFHPGPPAYTCWAQHIAGTIIETAISGT